MLALGLVLGLALSAAAVPSGRGVQLDIKELALEKQYVGCYNDTLSHDDLPHLAYSSDVINSPRQCVDTCRFQSFRYAGLQNGVDCYCGNNDIRAFGESTMCVVTCPDDVGSTCGGTLSNDVYRVSHDHRYLGCFNDDGEDFPHLVWQSDAGKSAHECVDQCAGLGFRYAAVENGGACSCGNGYGTGGAANETQCDVRCSAWGLENCGGVGVSAVYLTELAYDISEGNIDPSATKLFDTSATGIPTALYTLYPRVRTIVTKSLVLHSSTEIKTPIDDVTCAAGCYTACSEIEQNDQMINKGEDVHLRFFYLNLSDLKDYVGTRAQRVWVYAQTVIIDDSLQFSFALSVRAREMFINRATASLISTTSDRDLGADMTGTIDDPEADLMHLKQSLMCARILYDTFQSKDRETAWSVVYDISKTQSTKPEVASFAMTVRSYAVELAGLPRSDIHFVPFYTKSHLSRILESYSQRVAIYKDELERVEDAVENEQEFLDFTKEMHTIYATTNIAEAEKAYEASVDAITRTNATYNRIALYYEEARENLEVAHENFERALNESRQNSFKNFVRDFKKGVAQIGVGAVRIYFGDIPGGISNIIGGVDTLMDTMYNLATAMREIRQLMEMADDIIEAISVAEDHNELIKYLDDLEMMVELEVNVVRWENLRNFGYVILEDEEVVQIEGCHEYKRALLDFCNWGEALTRSMVEMAELMRDAIEKRLLLDIKLQQRDRILENFDKFEEDISKKELVLSDAIDQTYDVRLDLNNALLTFCQAFFYEHMQECMEAYKPSFGGSLTELLTRINAAKRDDLLNPGGGSTLSRIVDITDTDLSPECKDATKCPINYLRNNRILYFNLTTSNPELSDIDAYKVSAITLEFVGAKSASDNKYLKVGIESSGDFQGMQGGQSHNFLTRALSLAYEYHIVTGHVSIYADVYAPFRNIVQHITPFTTWIMRISDIRSSDIDLSDVTRIRMGLEGFGTAVGRSKRL